MVSVPCIIDTDTGIGIGPPLCVMRYMHCLNKIYALVAVHIFCKHFESVQYVIYMHWLSFDLRCESGVYIYICVCVYITYCTDSKCLQDIRIALTRYMHCYQCVLYSYTTATSALPDINA